MTCSNDDSAACCGLCHFKPTVVIATHKRVKITSQNIALLQKQSIKPEIVLVVSDSEEFIYYQETFPEVKLVFKENKPLGNKWQSGLIGSMDPLIILGSDDILLPGFIQKALKLLLQGYDMVGLTSWYSYDVKRKRLYHTQYKNKNVDFPIGSGKVYSKKLLQKMNYKVFDRGADRRLDDLGHQNAIKSGAKIHLIRDPEVIAVKGDWGEMNTIEAYLKSPNISSKLVDLNIIKTFGLCVV